MLRDTLPAPNLLLKPWVFSFCTRGGVVWKKEGMKKRGGHRGVSLNPPAPLHESRGTRTLDPRLKRPVLYQLSYRLVAALLSVFCVQVNNLFYMQGRRWSAYMEGAARFFQ